MFSKLRAYIFKETFAAFRIFCGTNVTPEVDETVAEIRLHIFWDNFVKLPLYLYRIVAVGKPEAV